MKRLNGGLMVCGAAFAAAAVAAVVAAVVVIATTPKARAVDIPFTDAGYEPIDSRVISSHEELDTFLARYADEPAPSGARFDKWEWEGQPKLQQREAFVNGLRASGVDFGKEVLVIAAFRVTPGEEASPTGRVTWADGVCVCRFTSKPAAKKGAAETHHAAAYIVPTRSVTEVKVLVNYLPADKVFEITG